MTVNNSAIQCCTSDGKYLSPERTHPLCFPIDVSQDHEFYGQFGGKRSSSRSTNVLLSFH